MFWKPARRGGTGRPQRPAMASWLTIYYAAAALVLLAAASAWFYVGLQSSLDRSSWESLEEKVRVVTGLLEHTPPGRAGIAPEVAEEAATSGALWSRFFLRVLDAHRRVLVETTGMSAVLPDDVFPRIAPGGTESRSEVSADLDDDAQPVRHRFLLISEAIPGTTGATAPRRLQAAFDVSDVQSLLAEYVRQALGVLIVGVLLASGIGAWIARRGLRPIVDITRATERIGFDRLHERIGEAGWPAELTALVGAFDRMLERLQQSFERLSQFSADLAHELRTPINNLIGEAQVALSHDRTSGEYVEVLQSALEEYGRLARMIDSMLFLAYADHTRTAPERVVLEAAHELQVVADFYQALAEESGIELICAGGGPLFAEPHLLRRALSNLVSNALKYTPRGGRVRLEAENDSGGCIVRVTDSGTGIPPEHLPKLSDRFYRVDRSRAGAPDGSGLGLAIVKSTLLLHGGTVAFDSTVGRGTTVRLYFPKSPA
jgi:two-component system heavy metal sensor histidine kinase CusS